MVGGIHVELTSHVGGLKDLIVTMKVNISTPNNETMEDIRVMEKDPTAESAKMAAMNGKKLINPLKMLLIWAAAMFFTLNTLMRNTIKLEYQAPDAIFSPKQVPTN